MITKCPECDCSKSFIANDLLICHHCGAVLDMRDSLGWYSESEGIHMTPQEMMLSMQTRRHEKKVHIAKHHKGGFHK